jgi:hypothetical protein
MNPRTRERAVSIASAVYTWTTYVESTHGGDKRGGEGDIWMFGLLVKGSNKLDRDVVSIRFKDWKRKPRRLTGGDLHW